MSQREIHGTRDLAYSNWHRVDSIKRYISEPEAKKLTMVDLDAILFIEYSSWTKEPVALIEAAHDIGQDDKDCSVLINLARRAKLRAYIVLYTASGLPNPADSRYTDIDYFRLRRLYPNPYPEFRTATPQQMANFLKLLRRQVSDKIFQDVS